MVGQKDFDQPLVRSEGARGLPIEVKRRMVILFAQFNGLTAVQKTIKAEFGLTLDGRMVEKYDCGGPRARVGKRLRELYADARAAYVGDVTAIGIAQQNHRLRLIERLVDKAETARDFSAAYKLLELAAREMGGVLTNVSKVEHKGTVEHRHLSIEDARAELAAKLSAVIDGGTLVPLALPSPTGEADQGQATDIAGQST